MSPPKSQEQGPDGLVVVDKPAGWTSHDVVGKLRRIYGIRRIGHAGTLDPDATGILLVGVGRVTRLLRFLTESPKVYRGEIGFGVATDTLDAAGTVLERRPMPDITTEDVEQAVTRFIGDIEQIPPMVSALKVGGKRLHELARKGEEVEREARKVHIDSIDVESFSGGPEPGFPRAVVTVRCGSGTYIRSLAADIGAALGGIAHLVWLRRLQVGPYGLDAALTVEQIEADPEAALRPALAAVAHLPRADVSDEVAHGVLHGAVFPSALLGEGEGERPAGPVAVVGPDEHLLAVYERGRVSARPMVVMSGAPTKAGDT
jgi:tRNA pseudouridine55 synthase